MVKELTFHGLLSKKVMNHGLDRWVKRLDVHQDMRLILQNQSTGGIRPL